MRIMTGLIACSLALGCGDDTTPPDNNGGGGGGGGGGPAIIEGGGTGGGAIAGALSLWVIDDDDRTPVVGATIIVEDGGKSLTAVTSAEGRADFTDDALDGEVVVHIFKDAYTFNTIAGLNARSARPQRTVGDIPDQPALTNKLVGAERRHSDCHG